MKLANKITIVTGAGRGIGRGIADRFSKEGARVAIIDYKPFEGTLLDGQRFYRLDVSDPGLWEKVVAEFLEKYGRIDVLVNNAAIVQYAAVHEVKIEEWNRAIAVNLTSVMLGMRAVLPAMRKQQSGSIINLSSIWGSVAAPGAASYHATKAGVHHLTKNVAVTYAKENIRANSIHPGIIHTPMMDEIAKDTVQWVISQTPAERTGQPEDIAAGAVYLAATNQPS